MVLDFKSPTVRFALTLVTLIVVLVCGMLGIEFDQSRIFANVLQNCTKIYSSRGRTATVCS